MMARFMRVLLRYLKACPCAPLTYLLDPEIVGGGAKREIAVSTWRGVMRSWQMA
jgi:hypothetical protein